MVAAVLADGKQLSRVIVPKALLLQTAQILQSRLGGLLGREIKHIPFSRKSQTTRDVVKLYHNVHRDLLNSSGVILALPEHILSFTLSGLQRLSDSRIQEATQMIEVQSWMTRMCRDVLDESDFTLAVKTQLIYPSGSQLTVDGHPHRWETAQALLSLVEGHLWNLQQDFPYSIEVVKRTAAGFPFVHFLRKDVEDALIARLADEICNSRTSILPTGGCTKDDRYTIRLFISEERVDPGVVGRIAQTFRDKPAALKNIFLLRGLLVHRILLLCLKKRWNVQYGLHPNRDPVAVPFHAKGVPSEQAEWGHPDVAILFTCLAFYYSGLSVAQLRQGLQHVLRSDDPSIGYDRWTHSSVTLPESLRHWNAVNIDDDGQILEIWQHLRLTVTVIDHYLNNFVFPVHAKQFCVKLQASGWDIPLFVGNKYSSVKITRQLDSKTSRALTTGFSGTNDNRRMLPLTIRQEDLPGLSHTNAEVLTYLLRPRNRGYVLAADSNGQHLSELALLEKLCSMEIRILIDAGAYVLEMDNKSLVKAWLDKDHMALAAVYFDTDNKAWVLYRNGNGKGVPLLASPFADNLEKCLVYLDEAHTRGTDLKLPALARGALTLGLGQTKDHTVQAAMRLRQLGSTQSITFFAPPEVHQSILDLRNKKHGDCLSSSDVVCWLLEQTCSSNKELQRLYFAQGADFCRRTHAAWEYSNFLTNLDHRTAYLQVLQQPEQRTLEQLYTPIFDSEHATTVELLSPKLHEFTEELRMRQQGSRTDTSTIQSSALEQVEQEREVAFEVEEVREVQKPVRFKALSFPGLHSAILQFAKTGELVSYGFQQVFAALRQTELGLKHDINAAVTHSRLYVSMEFTRTVKMKEGQPNDNFLRSVNWILWSPRTQTALIIIPEEAEALIPIVRVAEPPQTHLIVYAAPVTKKMLHFNNLMYYSLPRLQKTWKPPTWLTIELGIFAGRLYFEFGEYAALANYLGLSDFGDMGSRAADAVSAGADGIEGKQGRATEKQIQCFTKKPLSFLQEWIAIKRKGQDFVHTPMGYLCQGRRLRASHPFFAAGWALAADVDGAECVGLDLGGTARAYHGGFANRSGGDNAGYESDGSMDEDAEVEFGDNVDGYFEGGGDGDDLDGGGAVEPVVSGAHSTTNDASGAREGCGNGGDGGDGGDLDGGGAVESVVSRAHSTTGDASGAREGGGIIAP